MSNLVKRVVRHRQGDPRLTGIGLPRFRNSWHHRRSRSDSRQTLAEEAIVCNTSHVADPYSVAMFPRTSLIPSLVSVGMGSAVFLLGLLLVPSRQRSAELDWYKVTGDAERYLAMMNGHPQPYPWGGRWILPTLAASLPGDHLVTLRFVNYACLWLALIALSALGLKATKETRIGPLALAWVFSSTGVGLLLLFQNPTLTDSALLLCISAIGLLRMKENWLGLSCLIPVCVGVRESAIVFVLLFLLSKKWRLAALTTVASLVMLIYSRSLSNGTQIELPELGVRLIPKLYLGLGSVWIILAFLGVLVIKERLFSPERLSIKKAAIDFYAVASIGGLVALPLATDVPRLLVFLLPVTLPLSTRFIGRTRDLRVSAVASLAAIPAILTAVPTLPFRSRLPHVMTELDQYYLANVVLLGAAIVLAAAAACIVCFASLRGSSDLDGVRPARI